MRLVCPNCEAKYEVPEDAIPETGRDVQCANCGHAWYQMRARAPVGETTPVAAPPAAAAPVSPQSAAPESAAPEQVADPAPEPMSDPEPVVEPAASPVADQVADPGAPVPEAPTEPGAPSQAPVAETAEPPVEAAPAAGIAVTEDPAPEPSEVPATDATVVETPADAMAESAGLAGSVIAETVPAEDPATATDPAVDATPSAPAEASEDLAVTVSAADDANPDDMLVGDAVAAGSGSDATPETASVTAPAAPAYAVDDSVLAILREEAEREIEARRSEARPLEVQQDLGVDTLVAPSPIAAAAAAVTAPPDAEADDADGTARPAARRALLPDVEEINSTLRPSDQSGSGDPVAGAAEAVAEGRSSFRSGFLVVMTVAILGVALYIAAPMLRDAVPALAGMLDAYIGFVDSLRLQLDGLMQSATTAMNGETG